MNTSRSPIGAKGDTIDPLQLEDLLGTPGEQGEVWLATIKAKPELKYAVKVSAYPLTEDHKVAHERFIKEFDAIAKMRHPNIIRGYWQGTFPKGENQYPYYVMEYLGKEATTLRDAVVGLSTFSGSQIKDMSALIARVVAHAEPVSALVWQELSTQQQQFPSYQPSTPAGAEAQDSIVRALNKILEGPCLFDTERFKDVQLRSETTALIKQKPTGLNLHRLNRLLLEDFYPGELSQKPTIFQNPLRRRYLCLQAFFDVASALRHLHVDHEGHHLDVKPSNILVRPDASGCAHVTLIDFGFAGLLVAQKSTSPGVSAGRLTEKETSLHRPVAAETPQHLDLWQLCFAIKGLLDEHCTVPIEKDDFAFWPIDYALYSQFYALISRWSSSEAMAAPNTAKVAAFYNEVERLKSSFSMNDLLPDLRACTWYLRIPEIATVAKVVSAAHAIRIPQRQLVLYTDRIKRILGSSGMTALCYTKQLGFAHMVYPGAQGTRFEHSVGVYDLACHFILRMAGNPAFRRACPSLKDVLLFILSSLLHDVGHFPFAHQLEEFKEADFSEKQQSIVSRLIGKDNGHYERCLQLLRNGELHNILLGPDFQLDDSDIVHLHELIKAPDSRELSSALAFFGGLLSGAVDVDKLDYVERDANHCGVPYGSYVDVERIFETMRIWEEADGRIQLAFDERGIGSLEQLAVARHQLYTNVYWHRAVRAATAMFKHLFYLFQADFRDRGALEDLFYNSGSDDTVLSAIERELKSADQGKQTVKAALHLAEVISGGKRALYKAVVQRDFDIDVIDRYGGTTYNGQRRIARQLYEKLLEMNVWDVAVSECGEHNVLIDCRYDSWPVFGSIKIVSSGHSRPENLESRSPLIRQLGETFKRQACKIRVFVNFDAIGEEFRNPTGRARIEEIIRSQVKDKKP